VKPLLVEGLSQQVQPGEVMSDFIPNATAVNAIAKTVREIRSSESRVANTASAAIAEEIVSNVQYTLAHGFDKVKVFEILEAYRKEDIFSEKAIRMLCKEFTVRTR
jgi:hypothetical protein